MSLTFNKTLKANLKQTAAQGTNEVHFTEDGETYTYKNDGSLLKVGATALTGLKDFKKSNEVNKDDESFLATAKAVKAVNDLAAQANTKAEQAFQSASSGKATVASAITAKGVQTDATDTYQAMADNIGLIQTSLPSQEKTVTPTIADIEVTPDADKSLSKVTVKGDADLVGSNIKAGVDIFGVTGTFQGGQLDISGQTTKTGVFMQDVVKGDTVKAKLTEGEFNEMIHHGIDGVVKSATGFFSMDEQENYLAFAKDNGIYVYKKNGESFNLIGQESFGSSSPATGCCVSKDGRYIYVSVANTNGSQCYKLENDKITLVPEVSKLAGHCRGVAVSDDDKYIAFGSNATARPTLHLFKRDGDVFTKIELPSTLTGLQAEKVMFDKNNNLLFSNATAPYIRRISINETTLEVTDNPITQPTEVSGVGSYLEFNREKSILLWGSGTTKAYIYDYNNGNVVLRQELSYNSGTYRSGFTFYGDYLFAGGRTTSSAGFINYLYKRNPDTLIYEKTGLLEDKRYSLGYFSPKGTYLFITQEDAPFVAMYKLGGIETWIYKCGNNLDGSFASFGYVESAYTTGETGQYIEHFNR